jgi:hypothetical protein
MQTGIFNSKYKDIKESFLKDCGKLSVKELQSKYPTIKPELIYQWNYKGWLKSWGNGEIKSQGKCGIFKKEYNDIRESFIKDSKEMSIQELQKKYPIINPSLLYSWEYSGYLNKWTGRPLVDTKRVGIMKQKYDKIRENFLEDLKNGCSVCLLSIRYKISTTALYSWRDRGYFDEWV